MLDLALHVRSDSLPADVWHADALASGRVRVVPTGVAELDAQLPGGGWPVGALTEILQAPGAHAEWRLLLPALSRHGADAVMLVGAPHVPWAPSLGAQGLAVQRMLWVRVAKAGERLWAAEQALRCAGVDTVMAWLPHARADQLRRLHLAAAEFSKLLFVFRTTASFEASSPAALRLSLAHKPTHQGEPAKQPDRLSVRLLKRRGPPLEHAIALPAGSPALVRLLAASTLVASGHALDRAEAHA